MGNIEEEVFGFETMHIISILSIILQALSVYFVSLLCTARNESPVRWSMREDCDAELQFASAGEHCHCVWGIYGPCVMMS